MNSAYSKNVADSKRNNNTSATQPINNNTMNYNTNVACCALIGNTRQDNSFNVGMDVLDITMRTFTMLAQIQQEHTRGDSVSIPGASWETACLAHGCTHEQFGKAKSYCDALHVYREENGTLVLET
jgi:hypothetical protein